MGQKVNPHGLRVGIIKDWDSTWYADKKDYANFLVEDQKLRNYIQKKLVNSGVSKVAIERNNERVKVTVYTSKPGIIIGRNGASIQELNTELQKMSAQKVLVNVEEIKKPELDSQLVAEDIARQLENRITFRRGRLSPLLPRTGTLVRKSGPESRYAACFASAA